MTRFLPQKNTKIAESFGLNLRSLSSLRSFAAIELFKMLQARSAVGHSAVGNHLIG